MRTQFERDTELAWLLNAIKADLGTVDSRDNSSLVCNETVDWRRFLSLAVEHRVVAVAYDGLPTLAQGVTLPREFLESFSELNRALRLRQLRKVQDLLGIVRAFNTRGIRYSTLKGPALSQRLYGDPVKRHCNDLDFLVSKGDLVAVREALEKLGYVRSPETFDQRVNRGERMEDIGYHEHFTRPDGENQIEIHWRVSSLDFLDPGLAERILKRRRTEEIGGESVFVPRDNDLLDYLSLHGTAHCWHRLKWILDIAKLPDGLRFPASPNPGLERVCACREQIVGALFRQSTPESIERARGLDRWRLWAAVSQFSDIPSRQDGFANVFKRTFFVFSCTPGIGKKAAYLVQITTWRHFYAKFPIPKKLRFLYVFLAPIYWLWLKILNKSPYSDVFHDGSERQ